MSEELGTTQDDMCLSRPVHAVIIHAMKNPRSVKYLVRFPVSGEISPSNGSFLGSNPPAFSIISL